MFTAKEFKSKVKKILFRIWNNSSAENGITKDIIHLYWMF